MSKQLDMDLNGPTMGRPADHRRIARQRAAVFELMRDRRWRTLSQISFALGYPEASISARLRDFRKTKYGEHTVDRSRRDDPDRGWWEYRLTVNPGRDDE